MFRQSVSWACADNAIKRRITIRFDRRDIGMKELRFMDAKIYKVVVSYIFFAEYFINDINKKKRGL